MIKQLSASKKIDYLPILFKKQGGKCLYCKEPFEQLGDSIFEHLNNNRSDNRMENLALAHHGCNIKKITNFDYQIIANEQLKKNEDQVLSEREKIEDLTPTDISTEININVNNSSITEQFLIERISTDGSILFSEALDSIVFVCKTKTGHGSQQSIRNYIRAFVSPMGPFMISKDENGKKIIIQRMGI